VSETAREGVDDVDLSVPAGTNLTIVHLGADDFGGTTHQADVAADLMAITRKLRAKGSAVIIQTTYYETGDPAFAALDKNADAVDSWTTGLFWGPRAVLPQYDAGDVAHRHLNAAGTDIVVSRALPDVERVLRRLGYKPGT
jgi:hypothetical protein